MSETEAMRRGKWDDYLSERGLTRGEVGHRILEAYTAGFTRSEVAAFMRVSPGYVSTLAQVARGAV